MSEPSRTVERSASRPQWLRVRAPVGDNYDELKNLVRVNHLHTVCASARCPNIGECWEQRTATFMLLGDICTRSCGFCAVKTGRPEAVDWEEPARVAAAVQRLQLKYAVVTSVNRDEREDGGAPIFAETIRLIHERVPGCEVEVLIPDFKGLRPALETVVSAKPDVLNHNVETVPRLYPRVCPQAKFDRSVELIRRVKEIDPAMVTKSGMMVGLGETAEEVVDVMRSLRGADCDILTIGQYLRPSLQHLPVDRYCTPEEFADYRRIGLDLGFKHVESGPLVRSSYHAREHRMQTFESNAAASR